MDNIRNFVIIAHVDHGKSTLADRFLEITGTVEKRKMREQFLDMMALEREKGITIKMQPVRMLYRPDRSGLGGDVKVVKNDPAERSNDFNKRSDPTFILNLIDTPGHVDFSYEVSRALAAVEGAILLVDATQGVQAQTLANLHLAQKENLVIIPVVNKIDLPSAEVEKTVEEVSTLLGVRTEEIFKISGKTGEGAEELLAAVVEKIPPPGASDQSSIINYRNKPLRALIFDSQFDSYQGILAYVRVVEGTVRRGERVRFLAAASEAELVEVGICTPGRAAKDILSAGEIGYLATGIKEPEEVRVGDTVTNKLSITNDKLSVQALPGYKEPEPMVFASIFSQNQDEHELLRESLQRLKLNDAALYFEPEDSSILGRGFRAGFLGMLHMEIVSERLRREQGIELTFTNPSVAYQVRSHGREEIIYSAAKMPESHFIDSIQEQWVLVEIITPAAYLGALTSLVHDRSGNITETNNLGDRILLKFETPLREIIVDFYDQLKSVSQGFASMSYEPTGFRRADLVRLDILIAGEQALPLSDMVPRKDVYFIGRERVQKLKEILSRELFAVSLQAQAEGRILARETIPALKKDVTGYLYGGDRTRKMKLWKKQQKGKKKLKERGRVEIPADVFLKMLKHRS